MRRDLRSIATVAAFLILGVSPASAQNPFVGTWKGEWNNMTFDLVMELNHAYIERITNGSHQTWQSGQYYVEGNVLYREVLDWGPKSNPTYSIPPECYGRSYEPGCGIMAPQATAKPPNQRFAFKFNGPDEMTWQDTVYHGVITFIRR
jgi:hypothetical protein